MVLSGVMSRSKELKIPRSLRACRFKSGPGDHTISNKNNILAHDVEECFGDMVHRLPLIDTSLTRPLSSTSGVMQAVFPLLETI